MRYKPGHKEESRTRILQAAGRGFRRHGLGGIGVDGLAKEAGVTSGAFYGHFASKNDAFEAAAVAGLDSLCEGVAHFQREHGEAWLEAFVDFYLGYKRTCDLDDACGLQALTPEVARAETALRVHYEQALGRVVAQVAKGLPQPSAQTRTARAWALLALLSGGVTLTRAVADAGVSAAAAAAMRTSALAIARSS